MKKKSTVISEGSFIGNIEITSHNTLKVNLTTSNGDHISIKSNTYTLDIKKIEKLTFKI